MELKISILFITTLFTLVMTCGAKKNSGYIFTSPRTLNIGSINQLQLIRIGNLDAGTITVKLYYKVGYNGNLTLASENNYNLPQGKVDKIIKLFVAPFNNDDVYNGRIEISGDIGDETISGSDTVQFSTSKTNIIIIQTDKPLYKPGQDVKSRILKVDKHLKPSLKSSDLGDVYVMDPKGIRLFQFDKIPLGKGLYQLQFPLADEPALGQWTIHLNAGNDTETATFTVKQYELPKFEVKIQFPPFVLATANFIPIQVCAKYTYGKPVMGQLNLNLSLEHSSYETSSSSDSYNYNRFPVVQVSVKLDGCFNYTLNVSQIQTESYLHYRSIVAVANVIEDGTGVQMNDTENLDRTIEPLSLDFNTDLNDRQYFKPGLPYTGKLKVTNPDSTPAGGEPISLCYTVSKQRVIADWFASREVQYCKNFTSNNKGIIKYTIPPQNVDTKSISINAKSIKYASDPQNILGQPQASQNLNPFYSPSGSFIQLQNIGQALPCGTKKDVRLLFTSEGNVDFKLYYEVVRQGTVVQKATKKVSFTVEDDVSEEFQNVNTLISDSETQLFPPPKSSPSSSSSSSESYEDNCPAAKESDHLPKIGEVKLEIDVDYALSNEFNLLVFYVRDDKETVADSQKFAVEQCFKNKVDFEFSDSVRQPGQNTTVQITASPHSLCGLRVVDKSITLLDNSNQLTKDAVFGLIQAMDTGIYYDNNPCYDDNPQPGLPASSAIIRPPGIYSSSSYEDSYASFLETGFLVISNLFVITRPCSNNGGGGYHPLDDYYEGSNYESISEEYETAEYVTEESESEESSSSEGVSSVSAVSVRSKFPETWLFDLEMVGANGVCKSKETLPDTITQWVGNAVCLSPKDGLGISNTATINGFQLFFISYTLPSSAIRGEEFVIVVSIFSYVNDGALPITVSLDEPVGYQLVNSSIDGDVCIQPGKSQSFRLQVKATTVGKIDITVRAETAKSQDVCGSSEVSDSFARDAITQSLDVEAEGFTVDLVQSSLFCPSDNGFTGTYNLNLPIDVVKDSGRAYVDLTGDILGPSIQNVNNLVDIPTGCGEQNLVKFVPNYLVLDYLSDIGKLTDSLKSEAIQNLNRGYQRELTFRHDDGSFSAFTTDASGSMFLTAFVLRSFSQAKEYIFVEDDILDKAETWIIKRQDNDGCFPNIGKIVDSGIQGGIENDNSPTTITAYVLASLLISQYKNQTVIDSAKKCLDNNPPSNAYETFLVAYAEALAGDDDAANKLLDGIKPFERINDGAESYYMDNSTQAIDIETVSYAVLTNLQLGKSTTEVLPLVRYLTQNLKATGGFYSTQDTCVGLGALSKFAKLVYGDPLDIEVSITGGLQEITEINQDNKLLVQRKMVSKIPSTLQLEATGTGCALFQATIRYNSIAPPEKNKFYISVVGSCVGADCKQGIIAGFVRYLPQGETAGLSIVQIKMVTGIQPDSDSLLRLVNPKEGILKTEFEDNFVNIYYNEITSTGGGRFEFEVNKVVDVINPQPGTAKVFEYYVPENSATTTYTFENSESSGAFPTSGNSKSSGLSPSSGNSKSSESSPASGNSKSSGLSPSSGNSKSYVPSSELYNDADNFEPYSEAYGSSASSSIPSLENYV